MQSAQPDIETAVIDFAIGTNCGCSMDAKACLQSPYLPAIARQGAKYSVMSPDVHGIADRGWRTEVILAARLNSPQKLQLLSRADSCRGQQRESKDGCRCP